MSRPNPGKLGLFIAIVLVLSSLPVWLKGGLYLTNFEGDALHLADITLRIASGQVPHVDFLTPIGALAFWPISLFLRLGLDLGHAFAAGQTLFAAFVAVALWRGASTRLPPMTAYAFSAVVILLATSLAHGDGSGNIAVSMHYNRWAWAMAFAGTLIVALPPRARRLPWLDGGLIGALLVGLAMVKITYFVAFMPALLLIALVRREMKMLQAGLVTGIALAIVAFVVIGPEMARAYLADLRAVTQAPLRSAPGLDLPDLLISPAYLAPTLTILAAVLILRQSGGRTKGTVILILFPAFLYVTWQNFGNDPVWLLLLVALLAASFDSDRARFRLLAPLAAVALALSLPLIVVHGFSGPRLLTLDASRYTPLVPGRDRLDDLYLANLPAHLVRARVVQSVAGQPFAELEPLTERPDPVRFAGETLGDCQLMTGIKGTMEVLARAVEADEMPFLVADVLSSHWLYSGAPVPGAGPWTYGLASGLGAARTLLVPRCPMSLRARGAILSAVEEAGAEVALIRETPAYLLYRLGR